MDPTIISVKGRQVKERDEIKHLQSTMVQNTAKLDSSSRLFTPPKSIVECAGQQPRIKSSDGCDPAPSIQCRAVEEAQTVESQARRLSAMKCESSREIARPG